MIGVELETVTDQLKNNRQSILDNLARDWTPREIRDLASTLLRLSDAVDQDWVAPENKSIFNWPSALKRVERNAANLAWKARLVYDQRRLRKDYLPNGILGEPGWDMLLDLFMQYAGGAKVSITSLCIAADCPATTALRYIDQLEALGLVKRAPSATDRRITFVELTEKGILSVGQYLERID
jgi:predicted transcriptional regulator